MTILVPQRKWAFVAACAIAGALAIPLHAISTPISAVSAGFLGLLGLYAWRWSGLAHALRRPDPSGARRAAEAGAWVALGLMVGLLLLGVIRIGIEPVLPAIGARMAAAGALPIWRRLLVIYVAAVGEELFFRLILLSVVAGITARLARSPRQAPTPAAAWAANVVSALAFAAAHLPSWGEAGTPGPWIVASVLALNAAGGLFLGFVFVKRGIAAAMLAHAGADCAIQLIGPLTG